MFDCWSDLPGLEKGLGKSLQERELDISALQHVTVVEGALKTQREEIDSFYSKCYDKALVWLQPWIWIAKNPLQQVTFTPECISFRH